METVKNLQVSESNKSTIIQEICEKVQEELGMGTPDVFFAKSMKIALDVLKFYKWAHLLFLFRGQELIYQS